MSFTLCAPSKRQDDVATILPFSKHMQCLPFIPSLEGNGRALESGDLDSNHDSIIVNLCNPKQVVFPFRASVYLQNGVNTHIKKLLNSILRSIRFYFAYTREPVKIIE